MLEDKDQKKPKPAVKPKPAHLYGHKTSEIRTAPSNHFQISLNNARNDAAGSDNCEEPLPKPRKSLSRQPAQEPLVNSVSALPLQQARPPEDLDTVLTLPSTGSVISFEDESVDIPYSFDPQSYSSISRTLEKKVYMKNNVHSKESKEPADSKEAALSHNPLARFCWKSEEFLAIDPVASIEDLDFNADTFKSVENVSQARIEPSPEMFLDDILRKRRSFKSYASPVKKSEGLDDKVEEQVPENDSTGLSFLIPSVEEEEEVEGNEENHFEFKDVKETVEYLNLRDGKHPLITEDMPLYANLHLMDEEARKSLSVEDKEQIKKMNLFFGVKKDTKTDLEVEVFNSIVSGNALTTRVRTKGIQRGRRRLSHLKSNIKESPTSHASGQLLQDLSRVKKWAVDKVPLFHKGKNRSTEDLLSPSASVTDSSSWKQKFIKVMVRHFKREEAREEESTVVVATFGVPLEICPMSSNNKHVPAIVEFCITVVENLGLSSQGIYRIPGNNAGVNALLAELNKDPDSITFENERWQDVNVIGSLLKLFFRKLPEPLIISDIYSDIIETAKCPHREKKLLKLKLHLLSLPVTNRETLKYLANHLKRVADNQEVNKMNAHNLAIMFGPSLVHPKQDSTNQMLSDMKFQSDIVENIIKYCDWMFSSWSETSDIPPDDTDQAYDPGSSTNMELLANAEALLAIKPKEATEPDSPEDSSSVSFIKGFMRLSSRGKGRRKVSKTEGPLRVVMDLDREVELRKVNPNVNRLIHIWKNRNPGLVHKASPCLRRNLTQKYASKELEISAPLRNLSPQRSQPVGDSSTNENVFSSIKRYPAYSFQNTTIRGSDHQPHGKSTQAGSRQLRKKLSEGSEPLSEFGGKVALNWVTEPLPITSDFRSKEQHSTESEPSDVFAPMDNWVGRKESFIVSKPGGRGYFASSNPKGVNLFSGHSCMSKLPYERRDIIRDLQSPSSVQVGPNCMGKRKEFVYNSVAKGDIPLVKVHNR